MDDGRSPQNCKEQVKIKKGDRNRVRTLNAVLQQLSHRDKENYYNNQCKETEEKNKNKNRKGGEEI